MTALDRHVERWIVHHRAGWLDPIFFAVTWIGSSGAIWIAIALVVALRSRRWQVFALVVVADLAAEGIATLLKDAIDRRRPPLLYPSPKPLVHDPHSSAFPSGHATTSFACATVLAFAVPRLAPAFYVLAAAIAYSRVYVGVHWPADVVAGALLGIAIALLLLSAARWRSSRARTAG